MAVMRKDPHINRNVMLKHKSTFTQCTVLKLL